MFPPPVVPQIEDMPPEKLGETYPVSYSKKYVSLFSLKAFFNRLCSTS